MIDAKSFVVGFNLMCNTHSDCTGCPAQEIDCANSAEWVKLIPIVEEWIKEHPIARNVDYVATALMELGYEVDEDTLSQTCPPTKCSGYTSKPSNNCNMDCSQCKEWWFEAHDE